MSLKTWRNGEDAGVIKAIVDNNFKTLGKHLHNTVLCLSTEERSLLSSVYLSGNLIVFDKDIDGWFKYNSKTGTWESYSNNEGSSCTYNQVFTVNDWNNQIITIPYSVHMIAHPYVQMFIRINDSYQVVLGGVQIDENYNVTLFTDMPFEGEVVIK